MKHHDPATCQECRDIDELRAQNARLEAQRDDRGVPLAVWIGLAIIALAIFLGVTGRNPVDPATCEPVAVYQPACG